MGLLQKPKKVSFAITDDVAYIYPWSPSKFLLYGKFSDDQLTRKKIKNDEDLQSILKKNVNLNHLDDLHADLHDIKTANKKRMKTSRLRTDSLNQTYTLQNIFGEAEAPNHLEEIYIDETLINQPTLPSAAIFSPSTEKDLLSNNPREILKTNHTIQKINNKRKPLSSNFTLVGQSLADKEESPRQSLPHLATSKLSEALFGCIKQSDKSEARKYLRMPSIDSNDSFSVTSTQKPLLRTQISQRYAITETDLGNIQRLNEEDFASLDNHNAKQHRRPLPPVVDINNNNNNNTYSKMRPEHQERQDGFKNKIKNINKRTNRVGSTTKSCKREAHENASRSKQNVIQLYLSPREIGSCWK